MKSKPHFHSLSAVARLLAEALRKGGFAKADHRCARLLPACACLFAALARLSTQN
jgi:hypothetical protein